ncbi:DUF305 domain-containing protein [Micromonospora rubida]|uniref:DUF305 domain-containing protein n=1 Tax=Micromonospora rubida TaxID=2697657 RepID=UPI0013772246|nr:DUF305 domain-containing protein [Micromonospora rubida]NBE79846.1 DUF305 domain-containing protein [Micromonospora rubida]
MRPHAAHGVLRCLAALPLAALLAVAGCASPAAAPLPNGTGESPVAGSARTDPTDVPFLTAMVAHHDRTRVVAVEAAGRIVDPELRTLVAAIDATEADELATMRRWLAAAPADPAGGHAGHHGASATADPDPAPDPELDRLRSATAARFDAALVDVLTAHQRRAAALARAHLPVAVGPEVRALADRIERSRTAQLKLLSGLPAARPSS